MPTKNVTGIIAAIVVFTGFTFAQTTAFKYQGSLSDGGPPANGAYQMQFKLFDAPAAGSQIGNTLADIPVTASNGIFSVTLDFGSSALNGANRWIEIAVRRNSGEPYVTLSPREQISSSPYAVRTLSAQQADTALDSQKLGGVNANQFVQTNDARLSDARNPLAASANYIQNQNTGPQASSNFNISGNGTATSFNVNGPLTFGGIGAPPLAPAGGSRFYFDTATNKLRVSENGGAYVNVVGAGGVSGNGTTNRIPLWSAGTTLGDSNIFQSGSNIGIGTATPGAGLEVRGTGVGAQQRITDPTSGNSLVMQAGAASNLKITGFNYGNGTAQPLYLSTDGANTLINPNGGVLGVGTSTPHGGYRADFFGGIRSHSPSAAHFVAETTGGTNSWARSYWRTTNRSWLMGTSQNFNGDQLYIADETANATRMVINTAGHVGIGTTDPQSGLELRGTGLLTQQRITDSASGNSLVLQSGASGNMKVTGFNYGSNQAVPLYLSTDGANTVLNGGGGNVLQPGSGFGLPKAMLAVNGDGAVLLCYNGITGSTTNGCGFTVDRFGSGAYSLSLGLNPTTRFISVSLQNCPGCGGGPVGISYTVASTIVNVYIYETNDGGIGEPTHTDRPFTLIVY